MPIRPTMETLVETLRKMVADEEEEHFTDEELEAKLDAHRTQAVQARLWGLHEMIDLNMVYRIFNHAKGWWEDEAILYDPNGNVISDTLYTQNSVTGQWTFTDDASNFMPIRVTGYHYDRYAAAVDALEPWLATLKEQYTFSTGGVGAGAAHRSGVSQKYFQVRDLMKHYLSRRPVRIIPSSRSDLEP
ncbi:MAG: hypothetical protein WCD37_03620 [Chloroflexia bacterium]